MAEYSLRMVQNLFIPDNSAQGEETIFDGSHSIVMVGLDGTAGLAHDAHDCNANILGNVSFISTNIQVGGHTGLSSSMSVIMCNFSGSLKRITVLRCLRGLPGRVRCLALPPVRMAPMCHKSTVA